MEWRDPKARNDVAYYLPRIEISDRKIIDPGQERSLRPLLIEFLFSLDEAHTADIYLHRQYSSAVENSANSMKKNVETYARFFP